MDNISLSRTVFEIFDIEVLRIWPWPLTPKRHLGSKKILLFERPYMTSYLTSMDNISLSRTVFEIFDFKVLRVWPWPLTPKFHLGSNKFLSFERPYMTPYLTSMDTISLSRTVFEIFDFKVLRVWPWPLTPKGHLGSNKFLPFEKPCMTSYLTSMDTISLSRTVPEIFDFKVLRVWPWPLTPKGHLGLKNFIPLESPYMTSYLTSMDTISLSRTVLEIMPIKILKTEQNGGFWPFKGQGQESIFFYHRKGTSSHQTTSFEILLIKIGSALIWWHYGTGEKNVSGSVFQRVIFKGIRLPSWIPIISFYQMIDLYTELMRWDISVLEPSNDSIRIVLDTALYKYTVIISSSHAGLLISVFPNWTWISIMTSGNVVGSVASMQLDDVHWTSWCNNAIRWIIINKIILICSLLMNIHTYFVQTGTAIYFSCFCTINSLHNIQ